MSRPIGSRVARAGVAAAVLAVAQAAGAHVGSSDVFYEGLAGPYRVLIAIRPPPVAPGKLQVEIRSQDGEIRTVRIAALPLTGEASRLVPEPDRADPVSDDPRTFVGTVWLTRPGSWQVRVIADGSRGLGEVAVPVAGLPVRLQEMGPVLAAVLFGVLVLLGCGAVSLAAATFREAQLAPGVVPTSQQKRRARLLALPVVLGVLLASYVADRWWAGAVARYERNVYRPLRLRVASTAPGRLDLALEDPGWVESRRVDDLIADHGHVMHLFLVRVPDQEALWHLHPRQVGVARFAQDLPELPPGRYELFADVVHATGLAETPVAEVTLPATAGRPLAGDDAVAAGDPISRARPGGSVSPLAGGGRMIWGRPAGPLRAGAPVVLRFQVEERDGRPAEGLEPYMGMPGHAVVLRDDRSVFAHLHSFGSAPMAALAIAEAGLGVAGPFSDPHAGHAAPVTQPISFPYGFPKPGRYRLFVQIKRNGSIETGIFDTEVSE